MKIKRKRPGRPSLGNEKRLRLSMTLAPNLVERIEMRAKAAGMSASRMAETLLEEGLRARSAARSQGMARLGVDPGQVAALCRALGVRRLDLFGSALGSGFNAESDVDLLAEFQPGVVRTLFDRGRIQMEFERLFGRPVDLAELRLIDNPIRRQEILRTRQEIYAA